MKNKISVICTFYNEESCVDKFIETTVNEINKIDNIDYEIIFIDDCSTDKSFEKVLTHHKKNSKIKLIKLSRRFGPMESIVAGVQNATGDALVNIDIDLQDPPSLIPEMVKEWRENDVDVVYTTRTNRKGESQFKKIINKIGYKILKKFSNISIEEDSGDFRLISKRVVNEYKKFNEIYPFFRFVTDWIGFKRKQIFYERQARSIGKSKHPFGLGVIFNFFEISLIPFTDVPIRLALLFGIVSIFICSILIIITTYMYIIGVQTIKSITIFIAILFFGSIHSLILGILSLYINGISKDVKKRPLFIIDKIIGIEK